MMDDVIDQILKDDFSLLIELMNKGYEKFEISPIQNENLKHIMQIGELKE